MLTPGDSDAPDRTLTGHVGENRPLDNTNDNANRSALPNAAATCRGANYPWKRGVPGRTREARAWGLPSA